MQVFKNKKLIPKDAVRRSERRPQQKEILGTSRRKAAEEQWRRWNMKWWKVVILSGIRASRQLPNSCVSVNQNTCGDDLEHQLWTGPCFGGWLAAQSQVKKYVKSHISANHRCVHCVQVNNINISRLQVHEPDRRTPVWRPCVRILLAVHPHNTSSIRPYPPPCSSRRHYAERDVLVSFVPFQAVWIHGAFPSLSFVPAVSPSRCCRN